MEAAKKSVAAEVLTMPVIVASLGYMVDMYDLFLFSIVRVPSLKSLGLSGESLMNDGMLMLNLQMAGLLIGGLLWGILGDKKGRLSVLFGSILIYSLANIANAFVTNTTQYAVCRFIAGIGLAGELGAGITLVAEILRKEIRGYGTTLVATTGVLGAILAWFIADKFQWRVSYLIGGVLGLLLLFMRFRVFESGLFAKMNAKNIQKGNMLMLFGNRTRFMKYLKVILMGLPIWFVIGILITFSPEFGIALGLPDPVDAGLAVVIVFSGQVSGDMLSGFMSQRFKSRKKIMYFFLILNCCFAITYLLLPVKSMTLFYFICGCLGFCAGYWALYITVAAELFGTNLRATVATTVPNFVRGALIPITSLFLLFKQQLGLIYAALAVGLLVYFVALLSLYYVEETFSKDLDFVETD